MTVPRPSDVSAAAAFHRPTWAEVDVSAFRRNVRALARLLKPSVRLIVVLKADGYGHGAVPLARSVADDPDVPLWGFGVSSVEEGLALRRAGVLSRVLILGSLFPFDNFEAVLENNLTPTVASLAAARALERLAEAAGRRFSVHLKVDTGMGRIGVSPENAAPLLRFLLDSEALRLDGAYTHLAQTDSAEKTREQLALFSRVVEPLQKARRKVLLHAANSAATLLYPDSHLGAIRPGLALYGVPPLAALSEGTDLRPVLAWKTRAVFLKTVQPGTRISYGGTFRVQRPSRLATLPVGYADGYRRSFSNRAQVLVRGRRCPVVGRVTMDQVIVDVTDVPGADVGDEAVLLGAQGGERLTAEELAGWADTIPYEILCGISGRVPRVTVEKE